MVNILNLKRNITKVCRNSSNYKKYISKIRKVIFGSIFLGGIVSISSLYMFHHLNDAYNVFTFISLFVGLGASIITLISIIFGGMILKEMLSFHGSENYKKFEANYFLIEANKTNVLKSVKISKEEAEELDKNMSELRKELGEENYNKVLEKTKNEVRFLNNSESKSDNLLFYNVFCKKAQFI